MMFAFYGYIDVFVTPLYCLVGSLSMTCWTHAVLSVLCACVLYFCVCACSTQIELVSHRKAL